MKTHQPIPNKAMKTFFVVWGITDSHMYMEGTSPDDIRTQLKTKYGPKLSKSASIRPHVTGEQVYSKYPNLIRECKKAAILCDSEAAHAIAMYKMGFDFGGEAVNSYGGPKAVVHYAVQSRRFQPRPTA